MEIKVKRVVWKQAGLRAKDLAPNNQTWTYGKATDQHAMWAAGIGMASHTKFAEEGSIAVLMVEWRRKEAFGDDDKSLGGMYLNSKSGMVRIQAVTNIFENADGSMSLGEWKIDGKSIKLPKNIQDAVNFEGSWKS